MTQCVNISFQSGIEDIKMTDFKISITRCNKETVNHKLAVHINQQCLTQNISDFNAKNEVQNNIIVDPQVLAFWFAQNWWRLRWEVEKENLAAELQTDWSLSHSLASAGEGYIWPSVTFISDNSSIQAVVKNKQIPFSPLQFTYLEETQWLSPAEFEKGIDDFLAKVLTSFPENNDLKELWIAVCEERQNSEATLWRKLEAKAGYDPDEAPASMLEVFIQHSQAYGEASVLEFIDDKYQQPADSFAKLLEDLKRSKHSFRDDLSSELVGVQDERQNILQLAKKMAAYTREKIGNLYDPISDKLLCDFVGVNSQLISKANFAKDYAAGFKSNAPQNIIISGKRVTGRRFSLSRLLGDYLFTKDCQQEKLLIATNTRTARQKFQRAFAQELLCPADSVVDYLGTKTPTQNEIENAANHFRVSPLTVNYIFTDWFGY